MVSQIHRREPLPQDIETQQEAPLPQIPRNEEEAATAERAMQTRNGAEDERRGFESVFVYVRAEHGVDADETSDRAGKRVVPTGERIAVLVAIPRGGRGEGEVRDDAERWL